MHLIKSRAANGFLFLLTAILAAPSWAQSVFTVQIGAGAAPPAPLVSHGDMWNFFKPTNATPPIVNWQSISDASLPATWGTNAGGFGYGDPAIQGEATTLSDMVNRYTTFYIRKTFTVGALSDTTLPLQLIVDYDDGFVAYLDGVELTRGNTTNGPGSPIAYNATAASLHEASCCDSPPLHPATNINLGPVGARLAAGPHILALVGLNQAIGSSDFHLIADLQIGSGQGAAASGKFFALINTNAALLSGSNTVAGSTRVVVNGVDAAFNPALGTWSKTQSLSPGMNRLFIAALDASGAILAATNKDVIFEAGSTSVGGLVTGSTFWDSSMGVIHLTNDVVVTNGATLFIHEGVLVLLPAGVSIRAVAGGAIDVSGTDTNLVFFLPADGTGNWGGLNASGLGSTVTLRYVETAAGSVNFTSSAEGLVEDSYLHDRASIITANAAGFITVRRVHVKNYEETIFNSGTTLLAEDNLYEGLTAANSDCLEIQGGPPGSIVRRCTFRRSTGANSDAVDFNGTSGAHIESCLIHDISDKGISMGASGAGGSADFGISISNCLIYRVNTGIAVKDNGTATLYDTTISGSPFGLRLYQKFTTPIGGGHVTNAFNNLIWGNATSIELTNGATMVLDHSDVQGTNWPGAGNLSADPLFVNAAADDFLLAAGSPAHGSGLGGADMGVHFPVGGLPPAPMKLAANAVGFGPIQIWWQEDADNETGFVLERSTHAASWQFLGSVGPNVTNYTDNATTTDQLYFYRVRAGNASGPSLFSNIASAIRQSMTVVGGTLAANTTWSPAMGMILVLSDVIVPTNITLTVQAGSIVKITNGVFIRTLAGGVIDVTGTADDPVLFRPLVGTNYWGGLAANGANSFLTVRHAEVIGAPMQSLNGATGLIEDTFTHDYRTAVPPILFSADAASVTLRRVHVKYYYECNFKRSLMLVEESLFEWADSVSSDAIDFDGAPLGSTIRRSTFRHGPQNNCDAIDIGDSTIGVIIEDCLMYDFPNDKGVTIGDTPLFSYGVTIRNCLIYGCDAGIGVKNECTAFVYNSTIVNNNYGFHSYNKFTNNSATGGGLITNSYNNILWNNRTNVALYNNGIAVAAYSDIGLPNSFGPTNFITTANIDANPLFLNPALRDYRLAPASPAIGTGLGGATMGAHYPVGAPMAPSHPSFLSITASNGAAALRFWADSEKTYSVLASDVVIGPYLKIADVVSPPVPRITTVTNSVLSNARYFLLVTPMQ